MPRTSGSNPPCPITPRSRHQGLKVLYAATFAYISLTVFYIAGDFSSLTRAFLLQPFLQPRVIVCVIYGGLVDLSGISLSFYTTRP